MLKTQNQNFKTSAPESSKPNMNGNIHNIIDAAEKIKNELLYSDDYKHLTKLCRNHSTRDVHKNIRADLKKHFPKTKFSVTGSFSSVRISWTDGPKREDVDKIVMKFESYVTDITGDFRDPEPTAFNKIYGGKKYVFTERSYSDETIMKALLIVKNKFNLNFDLTVNDFKIGNYHYLTLDSKNSETINYFINRELHKL